MLSTITAAQIVVFVFSDSSSLMLKKTLIMLLHMGKGNSKFTFELNVKKCLNCDNLLKGFEHFHAVSVIANIPVVLYLFVTIIR